MGTDAQEEHAATPPETDIPPGNRWLLYLFFRPTLFFRHFVLESVPVLTGVAYYVFGVASAMDRLDTRLVRDEFQGKNIFGQVADSWPMYWTFSLILGLLSAALLVLIGGWWYRKRLEMCKAHQPDRDLSRKVYVFASLVWALPTVVYATWTTASYESPRASLAGDDLGSVAVLVFLFWSVVTSYRGATTAFALEKGLALTWFLILPLTLYLVLVGGVFALFSSGAITAEPNVSEPRSIDRPGFHLRYPGNWVIDRTIEDYDPDNFFSIQAPFADCVTFLHIGRDFASVDEAISAYRPQLAEQFSVQEWIDDDRWGTRTGRGARAEGSIPGHGKYEIKLFATNDDDIILVVQELCAASAFGKMSPGYGLIQRTFAWK